VLHILGEDPATQKNNPSWKGVELKKSKRKRTRREAARDQIRVKRTWNHPAKETNGRTKNSLADPKEKRPDWNKIPTGQIEANLNQTQI
jgi:hypothetical protein